MIGAPYTAEAAVVLRIPGFRDYALSSAASGLASSLLQAVILWQVYAISGSALSLGVVGLVAFVATGLSSLVTGAIVDAYDRRTILLLAQVVPGLSSLAMLAAIISAHVSLELVYGLVLITGLAAALESPARNALLPGLVPRSLLPRSLTLLAACGAVTSVTGPAVAGVLIVAGGIGATYACHLVLVALATLTLRRLKVVALRGDARLGMSAIKEGLAYVRSRSALLASMVLDMFAVLFGGARALLPVYAVDILHSNAIGYGVLAASLEAGTLLMAAILLVRASPVRVGRALLLAVAVFGVATVVFGLSTWLPLSIAAYAAVGMADQVSMVMRDMMLQLDTPDAVRGRVIGVSSVFISASNEIGAMESGLVAAAAGAVFAVISGGLACLVVVALIAWRVPSLRRYSR